MPALNNLYESKDEFRLIIAGKVVVIREPVNWDKVIITMKRDIVGEVGMNYEFTDGDITLGFTRYSGLETIEAQYNLYGVDAEVALHFGTVDENGVFAIRFQGDLKFANWDKNDYMVSVPVIRSAFEDKVRTRFDTKISMTASKSIDDTDITPATHKLISLHSAPLKKRFESIMGESQFSQSAENGHTGDPQFISYPTNAATVNQIDFVPETALLADYGHPSDRDWYFIKANESGTFKIKIEVESVLELKRSALLGGKVGNYAFQPYYQVIGYPEVRMNNPIPFLPTFIEGSSTKNRQAGVVHNFSHEFTISLLKGEFLYMYTKGTFDSGKEIHIKVILSKCVISIDGDTVTADSSAKVVLLHEAASQVLAGITGRNNAFKSTLLGRTDIGYARNGIGGLVAACNGFGIRGWLETEKPLIVDMKSIFETVNTLYAAGMGFEYVAGEEVLVFENFNYFFAGGEIINITGVANWGESAAKEIIFNELLFGYEKFPEDDKNLLEEFNTVHEYITPIKRHKNKLSRKSPAIGAGYALEEVRRKPKATNVDDSTNYDDEMFLIASKLAQALYTNITMVVNVDVSNGRRGYEGYFEQNYPFLVVGTTIEINGNPSLRFEIESVITNSTQTIVTFVQEVGFVDYVNASFKNVSFDIAAERNDFYEIAENVSSLAYNLRLNIRQMLYSWGKLINSGFNGLNPSLSIKPTLIKNNGNAKLKFVSAEQNKADNVLEASQKDDLFLKDLSGGFQLFKPNYLTFRAPLTWDDIDVIRKAHSNQLAGGDAAKNYGYITVKDNLGNERKGYLLEMNYNPVSEMTTLKLIEKWNS